jgi:DNA invertase Pin-like site-specific DNA recombinase
MENTRNKGKRLGRPPVTDLQKEQIKKLRAEGQDWKKIIKKLGISKTTYYDIIKEYF